MAAFPDSGQVFRQRIIGKQTDHILPGNHDLPRHAVIKFKHIINPDKTQSIIFDADNRKQIKIPEIILTK